MIVLSLLASACRRFAAAGAGTSRWARSGRRGRAGAWRRGPRGRRRHGCRRLETAELAVADLAGTPPAEDLQQDHAHGLWMPSWGRTGAHAWHRTWSRTRSNPTLIEPGTGRMRKQVRRASAASASTSGIRTGSFLNWRTSGSAMRSRCPATPCAWNVSIPEDAAHDQAASRTARPGADCPVSMPVRGAVWPVR